MRKIEVALPTGWHSVTGNQLIKLANLFLKHKTKPDFLTRCFFIFSEWKIMRRFPFKSEGKLWYWFRKKKDIPFAVNHDVFTTLVNDLKWITESFGLPASMPELKGYKSCNLHLYNVTLEAFLTADNYFNAWVQTEKQEYLNRLVSIFYYRKLEQWNPDKMDRRWKRFNRRSMASRYAVFMWFSGVKGFLVQKYPYIFSGNSTEKVSSEEVILNLLSSLNNGDVTNNKELFNTHLHECFHELNLKAEFLQNKNK